MVKNLFLVSIKKNVELREINKLYIEIIIFVELINKDVNIFWRDVDLNRTIKREEEDEDFDRVNYNI